MSSVKNWQPPRDSDRFIQKTNDDVNEWMDGFYVDGRDVPFNLHCLWAWQEQERRHNALHADLLAALKAITNSSPDAIPIKEAFEMAHRAIERATGGNA